MEATEAVEQIRGISPEELKLITDWNAWLQSYVQQAKERQRARDAALASEYGALAANKIPGMEYGSASNKGLTVFLMGDLGARKTSWCCSWPSPIVISIACEGGDDALLPYPRVALRQLQLSSNAGQLDPPPVFNILRPPSKEIKTISDFNTMVDNIVAMHRRWGIATVVIDCLTYLMDMWIAEHTADRRSNKAYKAAMQTGAADMMRPQDWGMLDQFLRDARVKLSNQGLNVIWTVVANYIYESDGKDMMKRELKEIIPLMQGRQRITLPGACKLHIFAEKNLVAHPTAHGRSAVSPIFWTTPTSKVQLLRHKYLDAFPAGHLVDPVFQTEPTFRAVWNELHGFIYLGP
jgi:hypothetical protein